MGRSASSRRVKRLRNKAVVSTTSRRSVEGKCTILDLFPSEVFLQVACLLDTYSMADLLRAFESLCGRAVIILLPEHEGYGKPCFFRGISSNVCRYSNDSDYWRLNFLIKLFEIDTRSQLFQSFTKSELKQIKSMSFIHFSGDIDEMGNTFIQKTLNSMHPYSPRTSFEYTKPGSCAFMSSITYRCKQHTLGKISSKLTSLVIDVPYGYIDDLILPNVKQLEIRFYKSASRIPVITNADIPRVETLRIKYYETLPVIKKSKIAYISKNNNSDGNLFELYDMNAFDIHYPCKADEKSSHTTHKSMDLKFTANFQKFSIVGGNSILFFTMFNFANATSILWYDTVHYATYYREFPKEEYDDIWYDKTYELPMVKSFIFFTSFPFWSYPCQITIPQLETLRLYTNQKQASGIGDIIMNVFGPEEPEDDSEYHSNFKCVDICCDLPLDDIGGGNHLVLEGMDLYLILYSDKLKYVNISGCYFGEDNEYLFEENPRAVAAVPHSGFGKPIEKVMQLELVRKRDSKVYQQDLLQLSSLACLCSHLTSLRITQAIGGDRYVPWTALSVLMPDSLLTDGLVLEIDRSFGNPLAFIESGSQMWETKFEEHSTRMPISLRRERLLRKWIAEPTGLLIGEQWKLRPDGYIEE